MKAWMWLGVGLAFLSVGCSGEDGASDGAGSGGAGSGGASGMNGGGMGAVGGTAGTAGMGGDIAIDPALPDGQVVAPWDQYCVATFTEDYSVGDRFGDVQLEVEAGDRYLLGAQGFFDETTIVYVGEGGPVEMEMAGTDEMPAPITTSCDSTRTVVKIGVFVDTIVYSDEALTMPLCTLQAGTLGAGGAVNFILADGGAYHVELMGLSVECDNATEGFVKAVRVDTEEGGHFGVPFATVLTPVM